MLIEAWLTLKWELQSSAGGVLTDELYPFAVGKFDSLVKEKYPKRIALDSNLAPIEITPYTPRFQYAAEKNGARHKLLQIGPGLATINYLTDYSWDSFKDDVFYLISSINEVYEEPLDFSTVSLRYRNAIPFDYNEESLIDFLNSNFNIEINLPSNIPGKKAKIKHPINSNLKFSYNLQDPLDKAIFVVATGLKKEEKGKTIPIIVQETEIISELDNVPNVQNAKLFSKWLESANQVANNWNFSEK